MSGLGAKSPVLEQLCFGDSHLFRLLLSFCFEFSSPRRAVDVVGGKEGGQPQRGGVADIEGADKAGEGRHSGGR